jgi:hypothetical protein
MSSSTLVQNKMSDAANDTTIHHLTEDVRSHPVRFDEECSFEETQTIGVFIHREHVYGTAAVSFGQVSSNPKNRMQARNTMRMVEIFGKICEQAMKSPFGHTVRDRRGYAHPRCETLIREIPYANGGQSSDGKKYMGWIIWLRYIYIGDEAENEDINMEKETGLRKLKERNFTRNPVWALSKSLHELSGGRSDPVAGKTFQINPRTGRGTAASLETRQTRWVDTMTKPQLADELMFYGGAFDYTSCLSRDLHAYNNPANPFASISTAKACDLAARMGGDADYCIPESYDGAVDWPDHGERVWRIRLNECTPHRLMHTFFPDQAKPDWDIDPPTMVYLQTRYLDPTLVEEKGEGIAKMRANASVRLNLQRALVDTQAQTMEGLRARMEAMYDHELRGVGEISFEDRAALKLSIQRRGNEFARTVLHPEGNLPNALKALCAGFQGVLERSVRHNLCMPLPHQFKNLTCLGENVNYQMLAMEKILGVHTLHRECLLATFCNYHIYFVGSFHPHVLYLGDHSTGKTMIIKYRELVSIPGTMMNCDHMSAQNFMTKDNRDIHFMILFSDEFEPSAVGLQPGSGVKQNVGGGQNNAMSDKASAIRAIMTSNTVSFSRLVRREDNGEYQRESAVVPMNILFMGAMNATASDLAPNSRSRWLVVNIQNRPREFSSVPGKIIATSGYANSPEFQLFKNRMIRDQVCKALLCFGVRVNLVRYRQWWARSASGSISRFWIPSTGPPRIPSSPRYSRTVAKRTCMGPTTCAISKRHA